MFGTPLKVPGGNGIWDSIVGYGAFLAGLARRTACS